MKIVLTNDDGIYAKGLKALYDRFAANHDVTVIAPDRERSAVGHGITLLEPLRADRVELDNIIQGYAVSGTPADCIKIGILKLLDNKPDMVISGINNGINTGVNINYSGTVAAAREAALYGIKSISVSIVGRNPDNYIGAAVFTEKLAAKVIQNGLPFGTVINVNIPDMPLDKIAGVRITRQGTQFPNEYIKGNIDPRNRTYFWYGCDLKTTFSDPEIDEAALAENFISITPIKCDMTDFDMADKLKDWGLEP
jgi:5'-nucleotidase